MTSHNLRWSHGEATVVSNSAMLTDCTFIVDGRRVQPFARAPWVGTVDDKAVTGHLRVLAADFVGLPFGSNRGYRNAPAAWQAVPELPAYRSTHGPCADLDWDIVSADENAVTFSIPYPEESMVERIERTISARSGAPALDFTMRIFARRRGATSVGLHPNFRLPETTGRLELKADFAFGEVHPGQVGLDGRYQFDSLGHVPHGEGSADMVHVPMAPATDKNVQLCGMRGPLVATWLDEDFAIELDWDRTLLPSLMIWHTDGGIGGYPWNNQFRGIGLEPIASAFDLPVEVSVADNPINRRGVATAINVDPAQPLEIRHSVRAFAT